MDDFRPAADRLRRRCDPGEFAWGSTEGVAPLERTIGQAGILAASSRS